LSPGLNIEEASGAEEGRGGTGKDTPVRGAGPL